jgi:anti-sigma factor RsiW
MARTPPPNPACQQQLLELSAYLEGDLTPDSMAALDAHLARCECCGQMAASLRRAIALCRSEDVRDLPADVQQRALARIRALLDAPPSPATGAPVDDDPS